MFVFFIGGVVVVLVIGYIVVRCEYEFEDIFREVLEKFMKSIELFKFGKYLVV